MIVFDPPVFFQVQTVALVVAAARPTPGFKLSNWKKNSTSTTTWPEEDALRLHTLCASPRDRSKSGSRTGAWSWRRSFGPSRRSTSKPDSRPNSKTRTMASGKATAAAARRALVRKRKPVKTSTLRKWNRILMVIREAGGKAYRTRTTIPEILPTQISAPLR